MSKMIQIRNVPDDVHRELKSRAALAGLSLTDYLLDILRRAAERATPDEIRAQLSELEPVESSEDSASVIRAQREGRAPA